MFGSLGGKLRAAAIKGSTYTTGNLLLLHGLTQGLGTLQGTSTPYAGLIGLGATVGTGLAAWPLNKHVFSAAAKTLEKHRTSRNQPRWKRALKPLALTAALAGAAIPAPRHLQELVSYHEAALNVIPGIERAEGPASCPQPVITNGLAGRTFNGLYADITGIHGTVEPQDTVDYCHALRQQWSKKMGRTGNPAVRDVYREQVLRYDPHNANKTTVEGLLGNAHAAMADVRQNLDWERMRVLAAPRDRAGNRIPLGDQRLALLRRISEQFTPEALLSYGMTELMASKNGELNKEALELIAKNAGEDYLHLIPAQHDDLTSFGLFQFTSHAIYEGPGGPRGASIPNQALPPSSRIPGSVKDLTGNDHYKAAYLNVIHNMGWFLRNLDDEQVGVLENVADRSEKDLTILAAAMHNKPKYGIQSGVYWLDNNAQSPLLVSCTPEVLTYCQKTAANYDALH